MACRLLRSTHGRSPPVNSPKVIGFPFNNPWGYSIESPSVKPLQGQDIITPTNFGSLLVPIPLPLGLVWPRSACSSQPSWMTPPRIMPVSVGLLKVATAGYACWPSSSSMALPGVWSLYVLWRLKTLDWITARRSMNY